MEIWILDTTFQSVTIVDSFESLLWIERYNEFGDFELYTMVDLNLIKNIKKGYYAWIQESESVMIIETIQISTEVEEGPKFIVSGRSLESILEHYIIWNQTTLSGNLQEGIRKLLDDNIINPSIPDRKIENFKFEESSDPFIKSLTLNAQYTGDNLYEVIHTICNVCNIGFKISLDDDYNFVFKLYNGTDRSYDQFENPYVIFSPKFENIISSNYIDSDKILRNVALVAGEGEGSSRRTITVGSGSGMDRRELYVDARDIQSETLNGQISDSEYEAKLKTRGEEKLSEYESTDSFEGEMITTKTFVYGVDFFKGDIVQFVNEYGMEAKVRVMELIRSQNTNGYSTYPTFSIIK